MSTTKQYRVKFSDQVDHKKFTNSSVNNNNNNNNSVYDSNSNDNSVLINSNNNNNYSRTNNSNSATTLKITQNNNNNKNGDYNNNVSCLHYSDNDYNKVKTIQIQKPQAQQQQQQQPKVTSTYQQSTYVHQPPFAVIDRVADVPVIRSTVNVLYPDSDFDVKQAKPLSAKCDNRQRSYSNDTLDDTVYLKIDTSNNNTSSKPYKSNTNLEKEEVSTTGTTFQISGIIPLKRPKQQQPQQPQNYSTGISTIITNNNTNNNNGYLKDQTTAATTYSSSYQTSNKKKGNNYESTLHIDEPDMSSHGYNIPIYKTSTITAKLPDFSNSSNNNNTYNYISNSNNNGTEIKINTYNNSASASNKHNSNYNNNNIYNYISSNVYSSSNNNNNNSSNNHNHNNYEEHFIEIPIIRISECKSKPFEYNSTAAQIQPVQHCVSIPVIYETKK